MEVPRHWRSKTKQRYALVRCGLPALLAAKIFPPRDVCPDCGDEAKTPCTPLAVRAKFSRTPTIYEAPTGFDHSASVYGGAGQTGRRPNGHRATNRPGRPAD